jgi:uncharacterized protein (TIGR02270 family)
MASTSSQESDVLWDVVEEHLAEAEFAVEQVDRALDSPLTTLKVLADGFESRLQAHVDGLIVGGAAVRQRLLEPLVTEKDPERPFALVLAGLVLAASGAFDAWKPVLADADPKVRAAGVRASAWTDGASLASWVVERLKSRPAQEESASLLEICGRRGIRVSPIVEWLQHDSPIVLRAAVQASRHTEAKTHLPVIEHLLGHVDEGVRDGAVVAALAWGSRAAWSTCAHLALNEARPHPMAMALYAALGGPAEHERLLRQLARPEHVRAAVFALGLTGNVRMLPVLLEQVTGGTPLVPKLAVQAISMITGLDVSTVAPPAKKPQSGEELPPPEQDAEALRSLPPLEEDDLDGDIVPPPEDALPEVDEALVRRHCDDAAARLAPDGRWLAGKPFDAEALWTQLRDAPLGRRHALGLSLFVRSGATAWIDTRALPTQQRRVLAGPPPRLPSGGRW